MYPAAQERIEALGPAGYGLAMKLFVVLGGDEPRKNGKAASLNYEVMIATAECDAAHLGHAQPSSLGSVLERQLLEKDDAMRD